MVVVFDRYTNGTDALQATLRRMEPNAMFAVLRDEPFVPRDILPLYDHFIYGQERDTLKEKRLHFNFLPVPNFWEIRTDGWHGAIYDMSCKKANVYLLDDTHDLQRVEWCMEDGWIYKIDYYNQYALKYASEFLDVDGNVESKVFYSCKNREVIVEQPQNDTVSLLEHGQVRGFFTSRAQFIEAFLQEIGPKDEPRVLFVQDKEGLQFVAMRQGEKSMWNHVLFLESALLEQYAGMGGQNGYLFYAVPEEYSANSAKPDVLILTASDQLEEIEYFVEQLPEITFHIAANTQVSNKLLRLGEQQNVKIYPQISTDDLNALWAQCDFYLDINYYWEIYNAVDTAGQKNLLIMGFENTVHHRELTADACLFSPAEREAFAALIKQLVGHPTLVQGQLAQQQAKRLALLNNLRRML